MDEYKKSNISISCKNYGTFFSSGIDGSSNSYKSSDIIEPNENSDTTEDNRIIIRPSSSDSGLKAWAIILIIIGGIIFIGAIILIVVCCLRKKNIENKNDTTNMAVIKN